ncbi:DUF6113 family protein [Actinomadura viridis]|uniref:Integral membrane protein n=1 Tax=Actinomadura viridis TaxID=58110 RepID=A0A931DFC2_9ACTN|nr:DUF6113 family protein [Actinomadura viridis]MBG6087267.1 hypothetical protein [Actinomadura viridis]
MNGDDDLPGPAAHQGPAGNGGAGAGDGAGEAPNEALEAFVSGAAYAALGVLGAVIGLIGSFAQEWTAGPVPVAGLVLIAVNFGTALAAGRAMGGRLAAAIPTLVWAAVAFAMSVRRPEGDLVVPGTLTGYLFIIGGLVAGVAAVSLVPSRRPPGEWLTGRASARE